MLTRPTRRFNVMPVALSLFVALAWLLSVTPTTTAAIHDGHPPLQTVSTQAARAANTHSSRILVSDLRVSQDKQSFRLVLDLTHKVRVVQRRDAASGLLMLDLRHVNLSKAAAEKFVSATLLPQSAQVTLAQQTDALRLSFNTGAVSTYRYYLLERPTRFVLDFTPTGASDADGGKSTRPRTAAAPAAPTAPTTPAAADEADTDVPTAAPRRTVDEIRTIVIDPGHGGKDTGTISRRGLEEKSITLKVALRLRDLVKSRLGKRVLMTRDHDEFIELGDRAKFANTSNADLFVSIHVNSHPQPVVKGIEVYHFGEAKDKRALEVAARENGTPMTGNSVGWEFLVADLLTSKRIEDSMELAWETKEAMLKRLSAQYPTDDHGVKTAPFYVLRYTAMPSILAEIAFMSNPTEEQLMRQSTFINDVAEALFAGVKNYVTPPASSSSNGH
ncbi:MAG: N-acetylmuramoyl-L-alanine amidase [Nitrospiraceae bacterium]